MEKIDSSLLVLEIDSIAYGYRALQIATLKNPVRVLDASPFGGRFLILIQGKFADLELAMEDVHRDMVNEKKEMLIEGVVIEFFEPTVRDALFALAQDQLSESLIVLECETVSDCLSLAQNLVKTYKLIPIEIRIQRSSSAKSYGFFTGSNAVCDQAARGMRVKILETQKSKVCHIELIDNPTREVRRFFQLAGEI